MFNIKPTYIIIAILTIALLFIVKCKEEPEVITNTVTKIVTKTDTITNVKIQEVPTVRYITKIETIKGNLTDIELFQVLVALVKEAF